MWIWESGMAGGGSALLGMLVGAGVFLPIYLVRGMGAGDVKLMAAAGTFLGPVHAFLAALTVAMVGGAIALYAAMREGRAGAAVRDSFRMLMPRARRKTLDDVRAGRATAIPYGLAICVGVLIYLFGVSRI